MSAVQKRVFRIEQPRGVRLNGSGKTNGAASAGGGIQIIATMKSWEP
ncbi:MAG: hypothetical protein OEM91_00065 [Hyphomicrobiales bacterium]|nr:hypothetical protein [Hyphomicrobiales bacterium]